MINNDKKHIGDAGKISTPGHVNLMNEIVQFIYLPSETVHYISVTSKRRMETEPMT